MNILAVETDWWDRRRLKRLLREILPDVNICVFDNTAQALAFARENPLAAAFIDMGKSMHMPGYFLAKEILALQKTNIIFTSYEWDGLREALELRVSGYIRKPLQYEEVQNEFQNLRYPLEEAGQSVAASPAAPEGKRLRRKLRGKKVNLL